MEISLISFLTILGMGVVTYLTRIGGIWLMTPIRLSGQLERTMKALPAAILVALVAPAVFTTSIADMGAALVTLLIAVKTRNVLLAMLVGWISVLGLRYIGMSQHVIIPQRILRSASFGCDCEVGITIRNRH